MAETPREAAGEETVAPEVHVGDPEPDSP
jgi:hypothetical protein